MPYYYTEQRLRNDWERLKQESKHFHTIINYNICENHRQWLKNSKSEEEFLESAFNAIKYIVNLWYVTGINIPLQMNELIRAYRTDNMYGYGNDKLFNGTGEAIAALARVSFGKYFELQMLNILNTIGCNTIFNNQHGNNILIDLTHPDEWEAADIVSMNQNNFVACIDVKHCTKFNNIETDNWFYNCSFKIDKLYKMANYINAQNNTNVKFDKQYIGCAITGGITEYCLIDTEALLKYIASNETEYCRYDNRVYSYLINRTAPFCISLQDFKEIKA